MIRARSLPDDSRSASGDAEWLPPDRDPRYQGRWDSASATNPGPPVETDSPPSLGASVRYREPKRRLWLHVALFLATIASTSWVQSPLYSACLISILTAHEFGHYFAARHYRVPATLPFFIPAPFFFGTMGALIRMSPFIPNRRALFDIAAAGPLAGVVLAIPISFVGMLMSERIPIREDTPGVLLGDPLLFQLFERIIYGPPGEDMHVLLHDAAFAGWVGLFVTALNLLPIGQLDGGHISYAVFGRRSLLVARTAFAVLFLVCVLQDFAYVGFLILLYFMGIRHGQTLDDTVPLGRGRTKLAVVLLAVFALCFTPVPITLNL